MTLAEAQEVQDASDSATTITYTLTDTSANLKAGTSTEATNTSTVNITDAEVNLTYAAIVNGVFGSGNVSFDGNVTATKSVLTANSDLYLGQATTVTIADTDTDLTVSDLTTFLNTAGDKLIGGYTIVDGVTNLVDAATNNDFTNEVVTNATTVSLLDNDNTMTVASASVISTLNFTGDYSLSDVSTDIETLSATTVDNSLLTTITLDDDFDATGYSDDATLKIIATSSGTATDADDLDGATFVDLTDAYSLTLKSSDVYEIDLGVTEAYNQVALDTTLTTDDIDTLSGGDFAIYYGYTAAGGFVEDSENVESALIAWSEDGTVEDGLVIHGATAGELPVLEINGMVFGTYADDTIDLDNVSSNATVVMITGDGEDTIENYVSTAIDLDVTNVATYGQGADAVSTIYTAASDSKVSVLTAELATGLTTADSNGVIAITDEAATDWSDVTTVIQSALTIDATAANNDVFVLLVDNGTDTQVYSYADVNDGFLAADDLTLLGTVTDIEVAGFVTADFVTA